MRRDGTNDPPALLSRSELETRVRELEAVIEALADQGLIVVGGQGALDTQYRAGYRKGIEDAQAASAEHYQNVEKPVRDALRALENTLIAAISFAGFTGLRHAALYHELRPQARKLAGELLATYDALGVKFLEVGLSFAESDERQIHQLIYALREFGFERDNGEALAVCELVQNSPAGEMWSALDTLRMGGRPASDARAWIGQRLTLAMQHSPGLSIPEATRALYQELIDRERANRLQAIEEKALAELDKRAGQEFRRSRGQNLTPKVKQFCKRAVRDWRKKGEQVGP